MTADPNDLQPLSLTALFLLGLLGSGHCVGMCGPLVAAFPGRVAGWAAQLAYHCGRLLTYGAVGALLGGIGPGLAGFGEPGSLQLTARIQIALSLVAALLLLLFGLSRLGLIREPELLSLANPDRLPGFSWLGQRLGTATPRSEHKPLGALFLLGLLLGLLPCGLSFAAFARALGAGGALAGASMTAAFGLGTLPAMLFVGLSASRLSTRHRRASDVIAGMLMIGMSATLIVAQF